MLTKFIKTTIKNGQIVSSFVSSEVEAVEVNPFICPHCGHSTTSWGALFTDNDGYCFCPSCGKNERW